ncbi:MAG: sce7726 family protein [Candidatus Marinimicrobia bacterium]|nr:sce7726 family protein [Candidatus Neomarinimicrobiota bacterium]
MKKNVQISNSYLRSMAKYLEGRNFLEVFLNNNCTQFTNFVFQLENHISVKKKYNKEKVLEKLYRFLLMNYRNDIVYKIEFLDSVEEFVDDVNKSFIINEFKIGKNLVDIAVFNGKSIAFEIKSDLDRASNISNQFNFYSETFDYCYLITNRKKIEELESRIPENAGIIIFNDKFNFTLLRKAKINENLSFTKLFKVLRKNEYLDIVRRFYNEIPNVPNTKIYKESSKLLSQIEFIEFKEEFLKKIKNRDNSIKISELTQIDKIRRQGYLSNTQFLTSN